MRTTFCMLLVSLLVTGTVRADWPQFRGPNGAGIADGPAPTEFGPGTNELWHISLGSGHSSPCIVGDSIFLTTFDQLNEKLGVVCIARANGEIRWRCDVPTEEIETGHPSFSPASSTPVSDGERVVAYFGSYGLICFDMAGAKLWDIKMPLARTYAGNATSPIIVDDRVILYRGTYDDHFVMAVDKQTGDELWITPQAESVTTAMACSSCPVVADDTLIVHTAGAVQAFELSSGKRLWRANCFTTATSTPVLARDEVIVTTWNQTGEPALTPRFPGFEELIDAHDEDKNRLIDRGELPKLMRFHRPDGTEAPQNGSPLRFTEVDTDENGTIDADEWNALLVRLEERRARTIAHGMLAIPIGSRGTLEPDQIRTLESKGIPEVPSPLCHEGYVYFVKNGGVLTCLELATGKRVYRMRVPGTGTYYASPVIADGKLFTTSGNGRITVLSLGPKPEVLASNDLGEEIFATPAIVDGTLYVRTPTKLFAFRQR